MADEATASDNSSLASELVDYIFIDIQAGQPDVTTGTTQTISGVGKLGSARIQIGDPSTATINIPMSGVAVQHEDAFKVALRKNPAYQNECRARLCWTDFEDDEITIMCGFIVERNHDLSNDSLTLKLLDDLYTLTKYTVFGQYIMAGDGTSVYFDASKPCVFNPQGWPSCMDSPYGPVHAPSPRFGWSFDTLTEPLPGNATTQARTWRVTDVIEYLRKCFVLNSDESADGVGYADVAQNPFPAVAPKQLDNQYISWPKGLGSQLIVPDNAPASTNPGATRRESRFVHDMSLEADTLLAALHKVCEAAGPFKPYFTPGDGDESAPPFSAELGFMFTGSPPPSDSKGKFTTTNKAVQGYLKESSEKFHKQTVVLGQPVKIERMVSSDGGTVGAAAESSPLCFDFTGNSMGSGTSTRSGSLTPKWTTDDETAWCRYIFDNKGLLGPAVAFARACEFYPLVFNAYGINRTFNYVLGTKYESTASTLPQLPPLLEPYLLTGIQCRVTPGVVGTNDPSYWRPLDIYVQCFTVAGDPSNTGAISTGTWNTPTYYDGLKLSMDRTYFELPGLRDSAEHPTFRGNINYSTTADFTSFKNQIKANHIRLTVVIEAQFKLFKQANKDDNATGGRVLTSSDYVYHSVTKDDYYEWLRKDSYPYGKRAETTSLPLTADGSGKVPDACTAGNELFSDDRAVNSPNSRIGFHADARQREVNRVYSGGGILLRNYEPGLSLGAVIGEWSSDTSPGIKADSRVTAITFDTDLQTFTYEFT